MWIDYTCSEVKKFHPVCKKALNNTLITLGLEKTYQILHHQTTGSLEMDFVIQNVKTGKYLCVVEVKRTPSDVHSARYQRQAMSYVQENEPNNEKPFYILTNLEYAFSFRYDASRPRVVQQILQPGLIEIGRFSDYSEKEFSEILAQRFSELLTRFIKNIYEYSATLRQFEDHMRSVSSNSKQWKSSLAILLYEYIRGAFNSIGRKDLPIDVLKLRKKIENICSEAIRVNFKDIFCYSTLYFESTSDVSNVMISELFDLGKRTVSGYAVADSLHSIASEGMEHSGEVPTDYELARIIAILANDVCNGINHNKYLCDPAAGSGSLITGAVEIFNVSPEQIKVNDINQKLIELLSLRLGLCFPKVIDTDNSPEISIADIVDLDDSYFLNIDAIVMNPPFIAGIHCVNSKKALFNRINSKTKKPAVTNVGQMSYEGAFLETICSLSTTETTIACILPKTHLVARGREAVALRKFLLTDFGLRYILTYPDEGTFESVVISTCVVVGKVRSSSDSIKFVSCSANVSDIDLQDFENALHQNFQTNKFQTLALGIEGVEKTKHELEMSIENGWRQTCWEYDEADSFIHNYLAASVKMKKLSSIEDSDDGIKRRKGSAANSVTGASELIFIDKKSDFYKKHKKWATQSGIKNADTLPSVQIGSGDSSVLNVDKMKSHQIEKAVDDYMLIPIKTGSQRKQDKDKAELIKVIKKDARKIMPANCVLLPRLIRVSGSVFMTTQEIVISSNFIVLFMKSSTNAKLMSTWVSTIFFQLMCEVNCKQMRGLRKMEKKDFEETFVPDFSTLTGTDKNALIKEFDKFTFIKLNSPEIRTVDKIWAEIIFGGKANEKLAEAKRLLGFLANTRNPLYKTRQSLLN